MNEQIRKLINQLGYDYYENGGVYRTDGTPLNQNDLGKIVELIVKECNKTMAKQYQGAIPQDVRHMMLVLQEHFGVEE